MGRPSPKRMRTQLLGILKDKLSLLKTTLLLSANRTTSFHLSILRATSHHPSQPPPDYTPDDVLALSPHHHHHRNHRPSAVVDALLNRLRRTRSAYVALKCLLTLHRIFLRGPPLLKDHISTRAHLLDLSTFSDHSDPDTWQLSLWVRWYSDVILHHLHLGERKISLNSLISTVEIICGGAPDSLHYQRISFVYEIMKLIGEDYRVIMREISNRIVELGERIEDLSEDGLSDLNLDLKRLEECKEKAFLMFLNKKSNDGVWDLVQKTRKDVERVKLRRESQRLVVRFQGNGSTRFEPDRVRDGESRSLAVVPAPRVKRWLDVDWNPFVVSLA